ncbi:hypothetical protein G7046_g2936 [Stylonectria norvegica]|nr:hypothetical protein G7046_g2936 [Stylonectria norvegica]
MQAKPSSLAQANLAVRVHSPVLGIMFLIAPKLGLLTLIAALVAGIARGADTTTTKTQTVFLPPRSTGGASNIYATVITVESSTTKYLLGCQTNLASSYTCGGDFQGVALTYGDSMMDVAFGATIYDCERSSGAVCETRTASAAVEVTTTLNAKESSSWMTAITVLDSSKKTSSKSTKTTTANAASETTSQADSGLYKRKTKNNQDSDGGDSDSGNSSSGGSSSSSGSSKSGKSKGNGKCSGGSVVVPIMLYTTLLMGLGTLIVLVA